MKTYNLLALTLALVACGDNKTRPDAAQRRDMGTPDAYCSDCPAAPTLGTQLDRMGRPAINTALNNAFTVPAMQTTIDAKKNEYNADSAVAAWQTAWVPVFAPSLAILDALDGGVCGNGICDAGEIAAVGVGQCTADCGTGTMVGSGLGCGNQAMYTPSNNAPAANSYNMLAGVLSADELYLDTSKGSCTTYLAVELGAIKTTPHTTCGGRAPAYDVIDATYSLVALGTVGFDANLVPQFGDTVPAHTDYLSTFPYLGVPH